MRPTRCSLIPTNAANTTRLVRTGRNSLASLLALAGALIPIVAHPLNMIRLAQVASLTSSRHFLVVLVRQQEHAEERAYAKISGDVLATTLSSPLKSHSRKLISAGREPSIFSQRRPARYVMGR